MNTVLLWFEILIKAGEVKSDQKVLEFIEQFLERQHAAYDYSFVKYIDALTDVEVTTFLS